MNIPIIFEYLWSLETTNKSMQKNLRYPKKRSAKRAALIEVTAVLRGVSTRQVQRVLAGDQNNDKVVDTYMELNEGFDKLIDEVKKMVPFN